MYKSYPKSKDTPNRKARKSERNKVFQYNRTILKVTRKARRLAQAETEEYR